MARESDHLAGRFETENTGGFLTGLLAEEDEFDRRSLWRLGSWGAASVGAVIVAVLAGQSSLGLRKEQLASAALARQSQQIQLNAKESQDEARRLASAIETLNTDRDRLYARVTVLEQGLDSVTGSIGRQVSATPSPPAAATAVTAAEPQSLPPIPVPAPVLSATPSPVPSPVAAAPAAAAEKPPAEAAAAREPGPATVAAIAKPPSNSLAATPVPSNSPAPTPAPQNSLPPTPAPLMASKSILAPPDAAPGKLIKSDTLSTAVTGSPLPEVVAAVRSADEPEPDPPWASGVAVQQTEFGVDVGGANSLGGLRALWRGLLKSSNSPLSTLRPIIVVKESTNGLGMQLRLVAGPLADAAAAAKICATLLESERACETTVFDGQRLAMKTEEPRPAAVKPAPAPRRHSTRKHAVQEEPPPKKPETSVLSSLLGRR
jgi:hypothetical protein